jgi:hypothetical protein
MERYRDRHVFDLLVSLSGNNDILVEIIAELDVPTLRAVACVSRKLHECALSYLTRIRFFYTTWTVTLSDSDTLSGFGRTFSSNDLNKFPSKQSLLASLVRDYPDVPKHRFLIGPVMEIDQTDEGSRSFYIGASNMLPLLPLAYARAKAKEKKKREMLALFREWQREREDSKMADSVSDAHDDERPRKKRRFE